MGLLQISGCKYTQRKFRVDNLLLGTGKWGESPVYGDDIFFKKDVISVKYAIKIILVKGKIVYFRILI